MYSKHADLVVKISVLEGFYQFLITFSLIVLKIVLSFKAATRDGQQPLEKATRNVRCIRSYRIRHIGTDLGIS